MDGLAIDWEPEANGVVRSLAIDQNNIYAGGDFSVIGGQARDYIAALNLNNGLATAWAPNANGTVSSLVLDESIIYVGGSFTTIGSLPRNNIAAITLSDGVVTDWNPDANGSISSMIDNEELLYVGGYFSSLGGQPRSNIAAVTKNSGRVTEWDASANNGVWSLIINGETIYAGGSFTSIGGQPRKFLAALDTESGLATSWNPSPNSAIYSLGLTGSTLYAGGLFSEVTNHPSYGFVGIETGQNFSFSAISPKTYGDPQFTLLANSINSSGAITFVSSDKDILDISGNIATIRSAGETLITANLEATETQPAASLKQLLSIAKATLSISILDQSREYGDTDPNFTMEITGFVNGEDVSALDFPAVAGSEATITSSPGIYPISLTTGSDKNYEIIVSFGSLVVTPATLTTKAIDNERTYGEENPTFEITYLGFKNTDDLSAIDVLPSVSTEATTISDVGEYTLIPAGGEDANYDFDYISGKLTIEKAVQEIAFTALPIDLTTNTNSLELQATTSSGLPVTFSSSNDDVAIVEGNMLSIESSGQTTITAAQSGDINYHPAEPVDQLLTIAAILGIPTVITNEITLFPNPVENELHLREKINQPGRLRLTDLNGKVLIDRNFQSLDRIEIQNLSNGVYLLFIETEHTSFATKIIKE
jgi:hypothetical protein